METGHIERVLSGEWVYGAGEFFIWTLFWRVPLVMAVLTLTLKDVASRRTNIVLGIIITATNIFHFIQHFIDWTSGHALLIVGSTIVATILIVRYAWKRPKE